MDPPAKPNSFRYNPPQQRLQIRPVFKSVATFEDKSKDQNDAVAEISIFDAHKYFCETKTESPPPLPSLTRLSSVSSDGYGRISRTRSFRATPTASSEASWNSQKGLLVNPPGSSRVSIKSISSRNIDGGNEIKKSSKNGIFSRKSSCCCGGGKSVCIKEAIAVDRKNVKSEGHHVAQVHPHKKVPSPQNVGFPAPAPIDPPRQRRISASGRPFADVAGGFKFPVPMNPPTFRVEKLDRKGEEAEDPPRDSLEVFQPNLESFKLGSPKARVETTEDDVGSDASSDLFELESFSTQTTVYPTYRRRDSLDEALTFNGRRFAPSANGFNSRNDETAAIGCYAPSEVSIDWSVTTAEGLDRASVSNFSVSASEIGGAALLRQRIQEEGGGKRKVSGGGGLLLTSCWDGKAVSVGRSR